MTPEEFALAAACGACMHHQPCMARRADLFRAALRERDARWLAVVKEIEWAGNLGQNYSGCTICDSEEKSGHGHDCALRALLEGAGKK